MGRRGGMGQEGDRRKPRFAHLLCPGQRLLEPGPIGPVDRDARRLFEPAGLWAMARRRRASGWPGTSWDARTGSRRSGTPRGPPKPIRSGGWACSRNVAREAGDGRRPSRSARTRPSTIPRSVPRAGISSAAGLARATWTRPGRRVGRPSSRPASHAGTRSRWRRSTCSTSSPKRRGRSWPASSIGRAARPSDYGWRFSTMN